MNLKQSLLLALKSIAANKMRAFLTMLGIIIGVGAVIILVSIVSGFTNTMLSTFESFGTNIINVNIMGRNSSRSISPEEIQELTDEYPELYTGSSPVINMQATVKYENKSHQTTGYGTNEVYKDIKSLEVPDGRFLQYLDVERRQKVCVIGTYLVNELFDGNNPLNKVVKINGEKYTVVGVLEETQSSTERGADDCIYIPYTIAMRQMGTGSVSTYNFGTLQNADQDMAVNKIEERLYKAFGSENAYFVFNQAAMLDMINTLTNTLMLVLVGIAGISLVVGGIGIMNIMLVSVTERTREIGIRKSLGAKRRDILSQFLIEAGTTSATGGVIGILFGYFVSFPLGSLLGVEASPTVISIVVAFSVSVGIGVIFGYFPARRASKMNPIDALRYE